MAPPEVRYHNFLMDSDRWNGFEFRDGDIVISTPAKCGTTWTQVICGLLVFQTPELPCPLDELSPWLDIQTHRRDDVVAMLDAQTHRRFIKTHTPMDGLPIDPRATYVCVGRDPRDVGISMDGHMANMNFETVMALRTAAVGPLQPGEGPDFPEPADTDYGRFWQWTDSDDMVIGLSALFSHLTSFWHRRDEPNVMLLHYQDLKDDLDGQMRRLSGHLGIPIDEERWPHLVHAATFEQMRKRADTLAPENSIWHDKAGFFRRGTSGQWRDMLTGDGDLARYRDRVAGLCDSELSAWVHRGPIE